MRAANAIVSARRTLLEAMTEPDKALPFRCDDPKAMQEMITEIVVASMISPDKERYRELFQQRQAEARGRVVA